MGHSCSFCFAEVSRSEAHIRSVAFRQVVYCHSCWEARLSELEVPAPRSSADELTTAES